MVNAIKVLNELQEFVQSNDITLINAPVGFTITASGNFLLKYSCGSGQLHKSIDSVIESIQEFLTQNQ